MFVLTACTEITLAEENDTTPEMVTCVGKLETSKG